MIFGGVEICCPVCKAGLRETGGKEPELRCDRCDRTFPVILGIPDLRVFPDPYIDLEADREKGRQVAERFADFDFAGLVGFYYGITPAVPPACARLYSRSVLAAGARAEADLAAWEGEADGEPPRRLLEIGCGTGPMLVAASRRFPEVTGIDVAFRWLVVAKKRLAEAAVQPALIAACAEALPFPDEAFDRVVADSVLEVVRDQRQVAAESRRVLRPGGRLFASTPNRFSLGPDPHAGLWAGGWLPERWVAAYVRRMGGIPPRRRLLSAAALRRLLREAGFEPEIRLPDVSSAQRKHFGAGVNLLVGGYHLAKRLPGARALLLRIAPVLHAIARKPPRS
ncbi:MAG: methyltransferase domain-containing protein [Candidatus Binatia bacterium]